MTSMKEEHAVPLLQSFKNDNGSTELEDQIKILPISKGKRVLLISACLYFAGSIALFFSAVLLRNRPQIVASPNAQLVYSPAQDAVRYKVTNFEAATHHPSIYASEPSPEIDRAWQDLYEVGISWITPQEASLLPNATSRIPGTPAHYIIGLDVFHQLHCLNKIRMALSPDYYGADAAMHVSHCMEHLRQAVMCNVDISTVFWTWSQPLKKTLADARVTHTCRDFDAVKEWAEGRRIEGRFDDGVFVEGGPVHVEEDVV